LRRLSEGVVVRVGTFNMRHGVGVDSILDLERSAEVIRAMDADLIGLQELDRGLRRSGGVDQPAVLAELTEMDVRFHRTVRTGGGEYGIAVAARGPIEDTFKSLPRAGNEEPRGAIIARWGDLSVVIAHLTKPGPARAAQLQAVADIANSLQPKVVVLGDLNTERHDLGPLIAAGLNPGPQHATMVMSPRVQIDYVMTDRNVRLTDSWTVDMRASDHVALVADIDLTDDP
jgi:endonuclease/exonuclease/phosphatase family metal-dependent hydrolase